VMKGGICWREAKDGDGRGDNKCEIVYVSSGSSSGKYEPVDQTPASKKLSLSKFSLIASLTSIVFVIIILCLIMGWFWGVPSFIGKKSREVDQLRNQLDEQQQIIGQLVSEKNSLPYKNISRDVCLQPPLSGPCTTSSFQRWFYNPQSGSCSQFTFGGCDGNGNNFVTLRQCEAMCKGVTGLTGGHDKGPTRGNDTICNDSPDAGPCRGQETRYYYDMTLGTCQQFLYGGCSGNENNFLTHGECVSRCRSPGSNNTVGRKSKSNQNNSVKNVCRLQVDGGPCSNFQRRWYFDGEVCQKFTWGGCLGNSNNFISRAKCEIKCNKTEEFPRQNDKEVCRLEKIHGKCRGFFERFYYNAEKNSCERFIYSGCGANGNNFVSVDDCTSLCLENSLESAEAEEKENVNDVDEICASDKDAGECEDQVERFYYELESEECQTFHYSGCGGNKNNFMSQQECLTFCGNVK